VIFCAPHPLGRGVDVADDRLAALGDMNVLDGHLLLASRAVSLERLDLSGEGPGELVEGVLGAVLLREIVDMGEATSEGHCGHMNGRHLGGEHRLGLVTWLDPFDH
jgi:hypothetical protein